MASNASKKFANTVEDSETDRYHLVWLDENMSKWSNQRVLRKLSRIDKKIASFTSKQDFIDYIRQPDKHDSSVHIIFIVSGSLSITAIPCVENVTTILAIFIFCTNIENYENLKFHKLRAICTDSDELIDFIEIYIARNKTTSDFSIMADQASTYTESMLSRDASEYQRPIRNLKEDQASFLWFHQMHKFMVSLKNEDDNIAKQEMVQFSKEHYSENIDVMQKINEFENKSLADDRKNAIHYYTENSFIYECTNTVLRKENASHVYSYRYFIKLLCRQLEEQYRVFIKEWQETSSVLKLYRGYALKREYIQLFTDNINNLISLNGFVSTTRDRRVAQKFMKERAYNDLEPVLFKIEIDMTIKHSVAFADISKFSRYPDEKEVLLSVGSIFRVKSVDSDPEHRSYIIYLTLSQPEQVTIISYIEQTYTSSTDSHDQLVLFGKLLFDMGQRKSALKYFLDIYNRLPNTDIQMQAACFNNIGICYNEFKEYDKALKYYEKAHKIYQQTGNSSAIATCLHNIASVYYAQNQHEEARRWALKAFELRRNTMERASTFDLLGCISLDVSDIDNAYDNFEQAFDLRKRYLSKTNPNHPDIGVSYHNLGRINEKAGKYKDAQENYLRAEKIYSHNYPESHPLIIKIKKCLGELQKHLRH